MPIEMLSYAELGERLKISPEAARALVKRQRLPRSRSNSGKTLVQVDLTEINHSPLARAPTPSGGHQVVTALNEHIATLQADLVEMKAIAGGHRADFERETDRSNRLMTELIKASNEITAASAKAAYFAGRLATAKQATANQPMAQPAEAKQTWSRPPKPILPSSSSLGNKHRLAHSIPGSAAALITVALLSWGVVTGLNRYLGPIEASALVTGSL